MTDSTSYYIIDNKLVKFPMPLNKFRINKFSETENEN